MKTIIFISLLLFGLSGSGCAPAGSFDARLNLIVKPYLFSITRWESISIPREVNQWISTLGEKTYDEVRVVTGYFSATERIQILQSGIAAARKDNSTLDPAPLEVELNQLKEQNSALQSAVERILEKQIRDTLSHEGIYNPFVELKINFPPVNFALENPPHLLVISPRDRIESMRKITLTPDLTPAEIGDIEAETDELGVSSLAVELGGLGATYPTFVTNDASLRFTIDTTVEEWLHQYLVFKPLGFLYLIDLSGLSRNYDIVTMNETLASMVSKEIGSLIYEKYYAGYENGAKHNQTSEPDFDFNLEMREIRRTVDMYLAQGQIETAEEFMEQKRQYLGSKGYYIRKLNQAYFAFHGTYADSLTSVSPIGVELKQLREQSGSLKNFLSTVAAMTRRQELKDTIK